MRTTLPYATSMLARVAFGLFTWTVAHALTYLLYAGTHPGVAPLPAVDEGVGPLLIAAFAFAVTALGALLSAPGPQVVAGARWGSSRAMAALAPMAFLLVELGEHVASGDDGRPIGLVVVGLVLHTVMGAATPLLWDAFVLGAVLLLVAGPGPDRECGPRAASGPARSRPRSRPDSRIWTRGPPSGRSSSPVTPAPA